MSPLRKSRACGVGHILTAECKSGVLRSRSDGQSPLKVAFGVGHNEDSISSIRGTDGTSRNNNRLRGVTDAFQVNKHIVEPQSDVTSNVFTNKPTGPDFR
ncbi:hypothetical protein J6TS7_64650 [Paenibacillus dendritiformis]|nr:hypothetical protein J6TS7_64650 [Paenibacillus dendritiformis]